jgi:sulfatase maturation enzyme AslB (radical SAM superfamily)
MDDNTNKNLSWCPMPWKGLTLRNNGEYRICIQSNTSVNAGKLFGAENERPLSIQNCSIEEARNSEHLKEIRRSMLEGKRHSSCERCNREEDAGLTSARILHNEFWKDNFTIEESRSNTKSDGTLNTKELPLGFLDIRLGNQCNLKCRMCGPSESTSWYQEHLETVGKGFRLYSQRIELQKIDGKIKIQGNDPMDWVNEESSWKEIEKNTGDLRMLHIVGGEPFLESRHFDFLEQLIRQGKSKSIIIDYNSNITHIPDRAFDIWNNFYEVRIGASIDAVGEFNEYIRFPSKWKQIEQNFDRLITNKKTLVWITTTVQIMNVFLIPDLYMWSLKKRISVGDFVSRIPLLRLHPLHSPACFSIQALPTKTKLKLRELYRSFDETLSSWLELASVPLETRERWQKEIHESCVGLLNFAEKKDISSELTNFWIKTQKMDLYRKQSFKDLYPDLAKELKTIESLNNGNFTSV